MGLTSTGATSPLTGWAAHVATVLAPFGTETVTIQRASRVDDGTGGRTETWATIATPKARIALEAGDVERPRGADREGSAPRWIVAFPTGTDIATDDRVLIGGDVYHVDEVRGHGTSDVEVHAVVVAESGRQ